jgi:transcriptional regulator with XRE-family HTH domain
MMKKAKAETNLPLRSLRILRGYDQNQLARAARLKQPDISYIETRKRQPTREQAEKICRILGAEPNNLFPEIFAPAIKTDSQQMAASGQ